jgi:hypothetical protein
LQDLTNVSSTAPGSGDNGKALVWNNTASKWESGSISQGNINLVNGGQSFGNAAGSSSTNQSYIAVNASGKPPATLFVKGVYVPNYGQFAVEASPEDNRAGFGLFGSGGSPRYVFFNGDPNVSSLFAQSELFGLFSQRSYPNDQIATFYSFSPSGQLTIGALGYGYILESTSTTTGNFVAPGGIGIGGNGTFGGYLRMVNSAPPATSGASGLVGQLAWDSSYFYVCVAANTWKRIALSTW